MSVEDWQGGRSKSRTGGLCRAAQSSSPSSQRHVIITGGNTGMASDVFALG